MRRIFLAFFFSAFAAAFAQQSPAPTATAVPEANATVFKIGEITVDKRARAVRFPAMVQLDNGPLEYLLVTEEGKTHESLFATKISPSKLHIAMLLLGASPTQEIKELPGGQINGASLKDAPELKGNKVDIFVSRKMTALLQANSTSGRPVLLHYSLAGGHSNGVSVQQDIEDNADQLTFLWTETGLGTTRK